MTYRAPSTTCSGPSNPGGRPQGRGDSGHYGDSSDIAAAVRWGRGVFFLGGGGGGGLGGGGVVGVYGGSREIWASACGPLTAWATSTDQGRRRPGRPRPRLGPLRTGLDRSRVERGVRTGRLRGQGLPLAINAVCTDQSGAASNSTSASVVW